MLVKTPVNIPLSRDHISRNKERPEDEICKILAEKREAPIAVIERETMQDVKKSRWPPFEKALSLLSRLRQGLFGQESPTAGSRNSVPRDVAGVTEMHM